MGETIVWLWREYEGTSWKGDSSVFQLWLLEAKNVITLCRTTHVGPHCVEPRTHTYCI